MRYRHQPRSGATVVESAVVYPIVFLFVLGFIIGAVGIFRYQEVASLAREGARYAAVHGTEYAKNAGVTAPTPEEIYNASIASRAVALDKNYITYAITYTQSNSQYSAEVVNGEWAYKQNVVTVQVNYQWVPEAFLGGITLSSTCSMPMNY